MAKPDPAPLDALEIFLQPGEFYFGDGTTRIRTLLGSCVAIVLWQPKLRIGGMCHFMLPSRSHGTMIAEQSLDGRYADDAIQMFMHELKRSRTSPGEYRTRLVGGGRMFRQPGGATGGIDISGRNMEAARDLMAQYGFTLHAQDMGGQGHRNVIFDLWSGNVWLKRVPLRPAASAGMAQ